jgi:hypothetical protein
VPTTPVTPDVKAKPPIKWPRFLRRVRLVEWLGFVAAIALGTMQVKILIQQMDIAQTQTSLMERIGAEQDESATLQAYISATEHAGFDDEDEIRMFHIAMDLFQRLERKDPSYSSLLGSLPPAPRARLEEVKRGRPASQQQALEHLFARRESLSVQAAAPDLPGDFHIVLVGNRDRAYALRNLAVAQRMASYGPRQLSARLYRNPSGFYLVTLSGFTNSGQAQQTMQTTNLSAFPDPYVSMATGWVLASL